MRYSQARQKQLTQELLGAFAAMSATEWELLGHELAEHITGARLRHRGLTVTGNPSGYTVDSYSSDGRIVAEYGTAADYFGTLEKPKADFDHALREAPQAEIVLLMSNRVGTNTEMLDVSVWVAEVRATTGVALDVYDARDLADLVLDDLLPRGRGDRIAPYLEPVRRLVQEQAASFQIPAPDPNAVPRPDLEARIQAALDSHRVVVLSGMSGLGKTETAKSVAMARRPAVDRVVWVANHALGSAAELGAVDVANVGLLENIQGMLATRSCLLVLDDVRTDRPLRALLDELAAACGPDARVLVTSQLGTGKENDIPLEFLDRDSAREVLQQGVDTPCPDDLFEAIWQSANGHPLALRESPRVWRRLV